MNDDPYSVELALGWFAFERGELAAAQHHFEKAHRLGHDHIVRHLAVHRALLRVAWMSGTVRRIVPELYSIVMLTLIRPFIG